MDVIIHHGGETRTAPADGWQTVADDMIARLGAWVPGVSRVERECSTFERQVTDTSARERIESTHEALRDAGVNVDASRQLFGTGTRMADSGYSKQAERAQEHAAKFPITDAAAMLVEQIRAERRKDVEVLAGDLGKALSVNGSLRFDGLKLREQAVRGVLGRLKSPALSYVLGLRERIAEMTATVQEREARGDGAQAGRRAIEADKAALLDVMQRECARYENTKLKLRTRDGLADVFAIVSPDYAPADAPDVLGDVLDALPGDARASFSYDPASTTWELRASVFTPTPTDAQAVGEPFEGYVAFSSRDNGTRKLTGGGGILLIACLNASTYEADSSTVSRRHVGAILTDLAAMSRDASRAIHALCTAWGTARADVIEVPELVPIEDAIPGFFRCMLTSRKGELVGVLPGRTTQHVERLTLAYGEQRRDRQNITRADLAQGVTRYIQDVPAAVRRDAERAIGRWIVNREPVAYVAA